MGYRCRHCKQAFSTADQAKRHRCNHPMSQGYPSNTNDSVMSSFIMPDSSPSYGGFGGGGMESTPSFSGGGGDFGGGGASSSWDSGSSDSGSSSSDSGSSGGGD